MSLPAANGRSYGRRDSRHIQAVLLERHARLARFIASRDMQRPTHPRLQLRDARDAHTVFEAVRRGVLKPVKRRLNDTERSMFIVSGSIFVWEESEEEAGLKRWTDGRFWSQSRMREPYLFYDEKLPSEETSGTGGSRSMYRFVEGPSRTRTSSTQSHYDRSDHHTAGLVKQAYSALVVVSPNTPPRKWHLTAYFAYSDLHTIPTIDRDPLLCNVTIPPGIYRSTKSRTKNTDTTPGYVSSATSSPTVSPNGVERLRVGETNVLPPPGSSDSRVRMTHPGEAGAVQPRRAEDERVIQLFNSRAIV